MTSEDVRSELEKEPFEPFRIHLLSGKAIDVTSPNAATLLQNSVMVFRNWHQRQASGYDVIALRNIERIEQRPRTSRRKSA
jgi:hypothetical protein